MRFRTTCYFCTLCWLSTWYILFCFVWSLPTLFHHIQLYFSLPTIGNSSSADELEYVSHALVLPWCAVVFIIFSFCEGKWGQNNHQPNALLWGLRLNMSQILFTFCLCCVLIFFWLFMLILINVLLCIYVACQKLCIVKFVSQHKSKQTMLLTEGNSEGIMQYKDL